MVTLQPQQFTLSPGALQALEDIKKTTSSNDKLQEQLKKAVDLITQTSAQLNDRGFEENTRYHKRRERQINKGELEDAEARDEHNDYQNKVETLTKKMDASIRQMIDDKLWLTEAPGAIEHVRRKADLTTRNTSTQATTQRTQNDDETGNEEPSMTQPDPSEAPTALLDAAFSTNQTKWQSKSLTEKYSENNDYVGWHRIVHDAKNPGEDAPPMPHASMWFAEEENRNATTFSRSSQSQSQSRARSGETRAARNGADPSDSDSDVEIAAERIRIKCPITLRPFKDPVASKKCPHAFEKSAILEMFKHTSEQLPFTSEELIELSQLTRQQERNKRERQMRKPVVRCPECSVPLTQNDLYEDPVLLRKVNRFLEREKRAQEAEQRAEADIGNDDDDDDEDEAPRGTQRRNIVHLGSSPARTARRQSGQVVKNERLSSAIATQFDVDDN